MSSWKCDSNIKYHCSECLYSSQWVFAFNTHMKRYHQNIFQNSFDCFVEIDGHQCKLCGYKTGLLVKLLQHRKRTHCTAPPLEDIKIDIKQVLLDIKFRMQEFDGAEHQCVHCGLTTFSKIFLMEHFKGCKLDGSLKKSRDCIKNEKRSKSKRHQGEKNKLLKCQHCAYQTKLKEDLKVHRFKIHRKEDQAAWFECNDCSYVTQIKRGLKIHRIRMHINATKLLKCPECGYQVKREYYLNEHRRKKHNVKICDLNTRTIQPKCQNDEYQRKLDEYSKVHQVDLIYDKDPWFQCKDCPYKSQLKNSLKWHQIRWHASEDEVK